MKTLLEILQNSEYLVKEINRYINKEHLDLYDAVEATAKRNINLFNGLSIDDCIEQIKTLYSFNTIKGLKL